jgi:hypothetical protein
MAATIPTCSSGNAAGTAIQNYMTSFHAAFAAAPGSFTIGNVVGSPVTSFTATHTDGWQINYRVSGGAILSLIAPSGGIANSASPGTPSNAYAEDTLIPSPSGTSTRWQFAQYGDAIFFAINGSANTFSVYGIHQGAIYAPGDADSVTRGLGTLAYIPCGDSNALLTTAFFWFGTNATAGNRKSYLRIAAGTWPSPTLPSGPSAYITQIAGFIASLTICAPDSGTPVSASSAQRGLLRYIQADTTTTAGNPLSVKPSLATDQGWLRINNSAAATRMVALWNKQVTP